MCDWRGPINQFYRSLFFYCLFYRLLEKYAKSRRLKSLNILDVFDIPLKATVYVAWFHGFEMFFGTDSQTFVYKGIDTCDTLNWRYEFSISGSYDSLNYLLFSLSLDSNSSRFQLGHEIFQAVNLLVTFLLLQKDWSTKDAWNFESFST